MVFLFVEKAHGQYNKTIPSVQVLPEAVGSMQEPNPQQFPHLGKGNRHLRLDCASSDVFRS